MKNKVKKVFAITAAVAIAVGMAGCGKGKPKVSVVVEDPNVTAPGVLPVVKDKIVLNVGTYSDNNITDYETNEYTKFLEEKTGIDLKFNVMVNPEQKLKVMLAADDELPEVLFGMSFDSDMMIKYGNKGAGTFVDLGQYMDNYGYYFNDMLSTTTIDNIEKQLYTTDGGRYFMPTIKEQTGNMYSCKAFINKKWLDKLGLEMPKTTEDLRTVLKAFTTQDPNGNGKKDEIGITGCYTGGWNTVPWHFLVNSFIYDDLSAQMTVENGKVKSIYYDDAFRKALEYVNSLYKDGLYDENAFTQDAAALKIIAQEDDERAGLIVAADIDSYFTGKPERLLDYVALPPLEGPEGVAYAVKSDIKPATGGVMTKYCKNQLAAFRLMDFMLSEEASIFSRYGVEGKDWKWAGENDKCLFESIGAKAKIVSILPYGSVQNSNWQERNVCFRKAEISDGMAWSGNKYDGEKFKADALSAYYGKEYKNRLTLTQYTEDEQEERAFLLADIKQHIDQEIPKFILGRRNLNEYKQFLKELDGLNFERYIEITQSGYDRANK